MWQRTRESFTCERSHAPIISFPYLPQMHRTYQLAARCTRYPPRICAHADFVHVIPSLVSIAGHYQERSAKIGYRRASKFDCQFLRDVFFFFFIHPITGFSFYHWWKRDPGSSHVSSPDVFSSIVLIVNYWESCYGKVEVQTLVGFNF